MLEPVMHVLRSQKIILASASPRRKEILNLVGLPFEVCESSYAEDLDPQKYKCPGDFAIATAYNKVEEVSMRLKNERKDVIIGADTVVVVDDLILGKPKTKEKAIDMLEMLSGRSHLVYTGVVIRAGSANIKFYEKTEVFFDHLSNDLIVSYVDTGEPLDKAGAYGIQGIGGSIVTKIIGDYFNVVGLPLNALCKNIYEIYKNKVL